jgi:cytochrome c
MYRSVRHLGELLLLISFPVAASAQPGGYAGIGQTALPEEIQAWDIDVRPDFQGLPPGSGSVERGRDIWDQQCAACHGYFGESTEVYRPIVGGTTANDIETGRAATLASGAPLLTTLSKLSAISTLWDYIHRAMPWTTPKSLSHDDVYAVSAYILHLGNIVPSDFVLSDGNIAEIQKILPNRLGTVRYDGLWHVDGEPDVQNSDCMEYCVHKVAIISEFPKRALAASGNPAHQNRPWGPILGVNVDDGTETSNRQAAATPASRDTAPAGSDYARDAGCLACHAIDRALVGPGFTEIAARYKGDEHAAAYLMDAVRTGTSGVWGTIPMPPQQVDGESLRIIVEWIMDGTPGSRP